MDILSTNPNIMLYAYSLHAAEALSILSSCSSSSCKLNKRRKATQNKDLIVNINFGIYHT